MRAGFMVLAVILAGCVDLQRVRGPDGELLYQVTCYSEGYAPCMNEAAEVCGRQGYQIIEKKSQSRTDVLVTNGSIIAAGGSTDRMLFRCGHVYDDDDDEDDDEDDDDDVAH